MADALLSPAVGATMWIASAGAIAFSSARLGREGDDRKAPLMGVLGAFLFAAQMINFSIPATGSSGHLSGGLLLAILLGPCAAFLTIASVLVVQAFFFADGGLLALGCNIFNLGLLPAFIVFPLVYRKIVGGDPSRFRQTAATMIAAVLALQLGAFAVVLETVGSGISALPFDKFLLLIQPIHLAIGLLEGAVTVAVISFVQRARPELLHAAVGVPAVRGSSRTPLLIAFLACAVITGGCLSFFASKDPDGLEWAIARVTGKAELKAPEHGVHGALSWLQEKSAWFPDYGFRPAQAAAPSAEPVQEQTVNIATGASGIIGTTLTLLLVLSAGFLLKKFSSGCRSPQSMKKTLLTKAAPDFR